MTVTNTTLKAILILLAVGLFNQTAAAEDTTFHGSQCQSLFEEGRNDGRIHITSSGFQNDSARTAYITCPVDVPHRKEVRFGLAHKVGDVRCTLQRRSPTNNGFTNASATPMGNGATIYFGALNRQSYDDTFVMYCTMKPYTKLEAYKIVERNF
jgi:hypothetical protein